MNDIQIGGALCFALSLPVNVSPSASSHPRPPFDKTMRKKNNDNKWAANRRSAARWRKACRECTTPRGTTTRARCFHGLKEEREGEGKAGAC